MNVCTYPRDLVDEEEIFIELLINLLNNDYYIMFSADTFYIKAYWSYQEIVNSCHFLHHIFIYGYDNEKKIFHIADFFKSKYEFKCHKRWTWKWCVLQLQNLWLCENIFEKNKWSWSSNFRNIFWWIIWWKNVYSHKLKLLGGKKYAKLDNARGNDKSIHMREVSVLLWGHVVNADAPLMAASTISSVM